MLASRGARRLLGAGVAGSLFTGYQYMQWSRSNANVDEFGEREQAAMANLTTLADSQKSEVVAIRRFMTDEEIDALLAMAKRVRPQCGLRKRDKYGVTKYVALAESLQPPCNHAHADTKMAKPHGTPRSCTPTVRCRRTQLGRLSWTRSWPL